MAKGDKFMEEGRKAMNVSGFSAFFQSKVTSPLLIIQLPH
jgi:hypothetical protein